MRDYNKFTITEYGKKVLDRCNKSDSMRASTIIDTIQQLKLGYYGIVPTDFDKYILPILKLMKDDIDTYEMQNGMTLMIPHEATTRQKNIAKKIIAGEIIDD